MPAMVRLTSLSRKLRFFTLLEVGSVAARAQTSRRECPLLEVYRYRNILVFLFLSNLNSGHLRIEQMKRKRPRSLKALVANIESGRVPLRRCGSGGNCPSCRAEPPRLFPYPTQCVAQRMAEATNKRPKHVNSYIVNERQRRSEDGANFFYFALHKPRGVGSMRRRGGGGCAARACRDWASPSGCRFGNACRFMHGDTSAKPNADAASRPRDAAASDIRGHRTAYEVLPPGWPAVPHVGRLDVDTEGLLLFTDDGRLLAAMTDPTQHACADGTGATRAMEKQYAVEVQRAGERAVER